jgi:PleD family two-component response regulator
MATTALSTVVLVATAESDALSEALQRLKFSVVEARTATLAIEWARDLLPDLIILDAALPDMAGLDACRALRSDLRIGHNVPILVMADEAPTPADRVAGLRAGVWEFLSPRVSAAELALKLQTYVQAKRNIDVALFGGLADPASGLHTRSALAHRARELGALMSRERGALACIVFELDPELVDLSVARLMARCGRVSDVVGTLGTNEFAIVAPGTDGPGALRLAQRVAGLLHETLHEDRPARSGPALRVGYDAVPNLMYSPTDPVELIARAASAVRTGTPERGFPWVRRYHPSRQLRSMASGTMMDMNGKAS